MSRDPNAPTGDYRATQHTQGQRVVRAHLDAALETYLVEGQRTTDSLPDEWQSAQRACVPIRFLWAKRVMRVSPTAFSARHYQGDYLSLRRPTALNVGDLVLVCTADPQMILLYLYMPDDFWYRTKLEPVMRAEGWGAIIRNYVRDWTALSYQQRIVRACTEIVLDVRESRDALMGDTNTAPANIGRMTEIIRTFESIRRTAIGEFHELSTAAVRQSFEAWLESVVAFTESSEQQVLETLNLALEANIPEQETENDAAIVLADSITNIFAEHGIHSNRNPADLPAKLRNILLLVHFAFRSGRWQHDTVEAVEQESAAATYVSPQRQRLLRNIRIRTTDQERE